MFNLHLFAFEKLLVLLVWTLSIRCHFCAMFYQKLVLPVQFVEVLFSKEWVGKTAGKSW